MACRSKLANFLATFGVDYSKVGAGSIFRNLFLHLEHLCLFDKDGSETFDMEDVASEKFFNTWKQIAAENEEIYEKVRFALSERTAKSDHLLF